MARAAHGTRTPNFECTHIVATARVIVKSINKDGSISRMALTPSAWRLNAFADEAAACARRAELEAMNPGHRYAVVAL